MAGNTSPIYVKNVTGKGTTWTNSDAANTKKTISPTVGSEGCRVHSIAATLSDTTSRDFSLYLNDGSTDFLIGTVTITASAGTAGASPAIGVTGLQTVLPWLASDGSLFIPTGWVLKAENLTQVASGKTATLLVWCGDY